jgi:hypothetical protein
MLTPHTVTVIVWAKPHVVTVYRKSNNVWIAYGDHGGVRITVQDRSERAALQRWRETARHSGNR